MKMAEEHDIAKSLKSVKHLYPVLKDAHGHVIDGDHRLTIDPNWPVNKLDYIKTETQLILARIIANTRRIVSRDERREEFSKLARSMTENDKIPREEVIKTISEITGFTYRYVQMLIPEEYKRVYTKSELSSQSEETGETETEKPSVEEYLKDYFEKNLVPDLDFLIWALCKNYGITEKNAKDAIDSMKPKASKAEEKKQKTRTSKYEEKQAPTCRCPMCMRDGADKLAILANFVENTVVAQRTLSEFVTEALK